MYQSYKELHIGKYLKFVSVLGAYHGIRHAEGKPMLSCVAFVNDSQRAPCSQHH